MAEERTNEAWLRVIRSVVHGRGSKGGYIVCFPEYRPDLVLGMAQALGLVHFDFRHEVMRYLGWEASTLQLEDLDRAIAERALGDGLVVQNAEALLSAKGEDLRRRWLKDFVAAPWPNVVILSLALYATAAPRKQPRVVTLGAQDLPEPTLLSRLVV
ncbi:MAG: hypothetical protein QNJ30_13170 [Kiloniellales bacterium]|nr:hypothetical protein [Kiloniellales bacterium]